MHVMRLLKDRGGCPSQRMEVFYGMAAHNDGVCLPFRALHSAAGLILGACAVCRLRRLPETGRRCRNGEKRVLAKRFLPGIVCAALAPRAFFVCSGRYIARQFRCMTGPPPRRKSAAGGRGESCNEPFFSPGDGRLSRRHTPARGAFPGGRTEAGRRHRIFSLVKRPVM